MGPLLVAAVIALVPSPEGDPTFAETRTSAEGRTLVLTGTGARKGDFTMALYLDELDARRAFSSLAARAGGKTRARLLQRDHAQSFVVWGHFTKLAVLRLQRAHDADQLSALFRPGLEEELGEKASHERRKAAEAFLALFDRGLAEGDELLLRTQDDGRIELELAGEKRTAPSSAKLQRALWNGWLGAKADLRRALVEKIDLLGR